MKDDTTRKQIRFGNLYQHISLVCGDNFSEWVKQACLERLDREHPDRAVSDLEVLVNKIESCDVRRILVTDPDLTEYFTQEWPKSHDPDKRFLVVAPRRSHCVDVGVQVCYRIFGQIMGFRAGKYTAGKVFSGALIVAGYDSPELYPELIKRLGSLHTPMIVLSNSDEWRAFAVDNNWLII